MIEPNVPSLVEMTVELARADERRRWARVFRRWLDAKDDRFAGSSAEDGLEDAIRALNANSGAHHEGDVED